MKFSLLQRRIGFSSIELIVTVSILAVLSVMVFNNYSQSQLLARNSRRKSDTGTVAKAIQARQVVEGNYFITMRGGVCAVYFKGSEYTSGIYTGVDCTGANGQGYGLLDVASKYVQQAGRNNYIYAPHSILASLRERFLANDVIDPSTTNHNDLNQRHIAILRCCISGKQSIATTSESFSVWAQLEVPLSTTLLNQSELTDEQRACGGDLAKPDGYPNYLYDFAAGDGHANYNFAIPGGTLPKTIRAEGPNYGKCAVS